MGDHPAVWTHCISQGRSLYSALGHWAEAYSETAHLHLLDDGIDWLIGARGVDCEMPE